MAKNEKTIYEMDIKELREEKKSVKEDAQEIETKLNNKTVKMVFGRKIEAVVTIDGEKMNAVEWKENRKAEEIALEMVENHSILIASMFDFSKKGNPVVNEEVEKNCKALGIDKKAFWISWDIHKLIMKSAYLEKIESQIEKRMERQGEEMKSLEDDIEDDEVPDELSKGE